MDVKVGIYVVIHFRDFIWMDGGVTVIPDHRLPNPITNPSRPKKNPDQINAWARLEQKISTRHKKWAGYGPNFLI